MSDCGYEEERIVSAGLGAYSELGWSREVTEEVTDGRDGPRWANESSSCEMSTLLSRQGYVGKGLRLDLYIDDRCIHTVYLLSVAAQIQSSSNYSVTWAIWKGHSVIYNLCTQRRVHECLDIRTKY
jgi:hypothetical protein